jgi:hypothetical protein
MTRPQFSQKTLLWLMAVVEAFLGGAEWKRHHDRDPLLNDFAPGPYYLDLSSFRDGRTAADASPWTQ